MYLKRLVLHGFKSFADRTVVELEPGVTGIVGPNGCGKSNIADAIKWVLGEQSPKSLRASSMQDVLFEGADTRPAMSFCEVSLTFTDCEAQMGTAFNEVEVSRRVERDGGSDYTINGKSCRLKDIHQLFRDTGIGRVAYSFLQQGQIDKLLSSNPVERRTVFEEAAGISGFKVKREETIKKLGEVETNLARVSDILTEVSSQMTSLKRQAAKAVRATRLKRQLSALESALVAYDYAAIATHITAKAATIPPQEADVAEKQTALNTREEELKSVEGALGALLERQQGLSNEIFEAKSAREEALSHARFLSLRAEEATGRVGALNNQLSTVATEQEGLASQRTQIEERLAAATQNAAATKAATAAAQAAYNDTQKAYDNALNEELELRSASTQQEGAIASLRAKLSAMELEQHGLQAQLGPIAAQRETLKAEAERLEADRATVAAQLKACEETLASLATQLTAAQSNLVSLKQQSATARTTFEQQQRRHAELTVEKNLLEELNRRYEGFGNATKELLKGGLFRPLVEGLEIEPEATKAIEALLALELDAVLPKTPAALSFATLKEGQRIALPHFTSTAAAPTAAVEGFVAAADLIKTSPALAFLKNRLEGCYVCRDAARFETLVNQGASAAAFDFVAIANSEGAMIDGRGLYTAPNAGSNKASFLERAQRAKELEGAITTSESDLQAAKQTLTQLDHKLADAEVVLQRLRGETATRQADKNSYNQSLNKTREAIARVEAQTQKLNSQTASADARLATLTQERTTQQARFDELLAAKQSSDERVQALSQKLVDARTARDAAYTSHSEAKLAEAHGRHEAEAAAEANRNLLNRLAELKARAEALSAEVTRLSADAAQYAQQSQEKSALAETHAAKLATLEETLTALKAQIEAQEGAHTAARQALDTLRQAANAAQSALMRARLEFGELETRRNLLVEDFQRRFGETADIMALNWRGSLFEADSFAKADEATLELGTVTLPEQTELEARYAELDRHTLSTDCQTLRQKLEGIGPINESALEDYKAHDARYTTLKTQSEDLLAAKNELANALMELNAQSSTLFNTTFDTIRTNFRQTFEKLFGGGKADLVLTTPEDPLNSGIEIMARPPGTQLKQLGLLSGGQKTMTAVALLFAIYQVKPSPFCVLDELDAPLDDANIGRFLTLLKEFTQFSQFLIITHNKRTMASSNVLYGVTMQERGVSKMLSMRLAQAENYSKPAPVEEPAPADDTAEAAQKAAEVAARFSLASLEKQQEADAETQAAQTAEVTPAEETTSV